MGYGQDLQTKREALGITLSELSALTGVRIATLERSERLDRRPPMHAAWLLQRWMEPEKRKGPCPCAKCVVPREPRVSSPDIASLALALEQLVDTILMTDWSEVMQAMQGFRDDWRQMEGDLARLISTVDRWDAHYVNLLRKFGIYGHERDEGLQAILAKDSTNAYRDWTKDSRTWGTSDRGWNEGAGG